MKAQIRDGVFETASSAVHGLVVSDKGLSPCRLKIEDDCHIHINLDQEFGKEEKVFTSQKDKLKYIVSWIYSYYDFDEEKINNGFIWIEFNQVFSEYVNKHKGTINVNNPYCLGVKVDKCKFKSGYDVFDHQLDPYRGNDGGCVVTLWNPEKTVEFIFNKYMGLQTGCD